MVGENDYWVLLGILSTSCILTVPLINWSSTLRNLGARHDKKDSSSRTIIIYWGFLVSVGFLCCFVALWDPNNYFLSFNYSSVTTVTCAPKSGQLNLTAGQNADWSGLIITEDFIQQNNCIDPCSGQPIPGRGAIFRSDSDYVTLDMANINYLFDDKLTLTKKQQRNQAFFEFYTTYGLCLLPYILLQGIWAASFGRKSPREVRDKVYIYLYQLKVYHFTSDQAKQIDREAYAHARRAQRWVSKYFSLTMYLWALFVTALCAPMLVANVIANEIWIQYLPQSETACHIGAWAPWAATGLVLFAAGVARFQDDILKNTKKIMIEAKMRPLHVPHAIERRYRMWRKKGPLDAERAVRPGLNGYQRKKSVGPYPNVIRTTGWSAFETLGGPFNRIRDRICRGLNILAKEWFYLKQFYRNPDHAEEFVPPRRTDHYKTWKDGQNRKHSSSEEVTPKSSYDSIKTREYPRMELGVPIGVPLSVPNPVLSSNRPRRASDSLVSHPGLLTDPSDMAKFPINAPPTESDIRSSIHKQLPPLPPSIPPDQAPVHHATPDQVASVESAEENESLLGQSNQDREAQQIRASTGLNQSFEGAITARKRRSEAYSPEFSPFSSFPHRTSIPSPAEMGAASEQEHPAMPSPYTDFSPPTPGPLISEPEMQHLMARSPSPAILLDSRNMGSYLNLNAAPALRAPHEARSRSTVSYLQVQRPATQLFGDEIRLRKDEYGVYHIVEERGGLERGQSWLDEGGVD